MAVATRVDSFITPTITQQNLYDGIKQAFAFAGYPAPFDEFISGTDKIAVYAAVVDSSKPAGTAYLRIRVTTALAVAIQNYSAWTIASHTGANGSSEVFYSGLANNIQVNFIALNANLELKLVLVYQNATYYPLGHFSPANKPSWWDLNSFPYVFIPTSNIYTPLRTSYSNPYNNSDYDIALSGTSRLGTAHTISNRRDILQGLILLTQSNAGLSGRTSDDLVLFSGSGVSRFDVLQIPNSTNQYLVIMPGSGGLAVRIA